MQLTTWKLKDNITYQFYLCKDLLTELGLFSEQQTCQPLRKLNVEVTYDYAKSSEIWLFCPDQI